MNPALLLTLLPMALGVVAADPGRVAQGVTRLVIRDEVVWRVPVTPRAQQQRVGWIERKGPKCVPTGAIRRAMLNSSANAQSATVSLSSPGV